MRLISTVIQICLIFIVLFAEYSFCGDKIPKEKFLAATIVPNLKNDVHAVVRYENQLLKILNIRKASLKVHKIVTVLDAEGRDFGELSLYYDKFISIEDLDGRILDSGGKEIRSLEKKNINDYAATSDFSLYDDNRVRTASLYHSTYPYTIEFEYEITYEGYISLPSWYPEEQKASVEYSKFEVVFPSSMKLQHWKNISDEPAVRQEGNNTIYIWEATLLMPIQIEPIGPDAIDQHKCVRVAPEKFEIDGYKGDFSSWTTFGEWFYKLYEKRQTLPVKTRDEILAITDGLTSEKEKIRFLYEYLQSKTRYVSIQLGIGGWRPFDAAYVCERGYGDCKALTNYMMSLLNIVNVKAYPALIYNNSLPRNLLGNFPSNQFNHVILCVPIGSDTVWLECTSQDIPFGHIGKNNENRYALLVNSDGGNLVRTPASKATQNCQIRKSKVFITGSGDATAEIQTIYTGNQQDYVRLGLKNVTQKEREEWLNANIKLPTFNLQKADFTGIERKSDTIRFDINIHLPRYASTPGNRLLFQPNLMERRTYVPKPLEKRQHPIVQSYPYLDIDTISFVFPRSFTVEALPKSVVIDAGFAKFFSNINLINPDTLLYTRHLEINSTELPPDMYNEYRKFFQDVAQADKSIAALIRR
jgi:transglutaminase-like putative cysteine protease